MTFDDLKSVNAKINAMPYKSEVGDDWSPITEAGDDCDSYATAKYACLVQMGWPKSSLRLATCWVETGDYHAVLLVNYEGQTWVLDNRHGWPMEYQLLKYKFDDIQIAGTQNWEKA